MSSQNESIVPLKTENKNNKGKLIKFLKLPSIFSLSLLTNSVPIKYMSKVFFPFTSYSSLFYYGSIFFMYSSSLDHTLQIIAKHKRKNKLKKLLEELKEEFPMKDKSNSSSTSINSLEILFFIYFKCLNEVYSEEKKKFIIQRRLFLKEGLTMSYIKTCLNYFKEELEYEEEIFEEISKSFNIKFDLIQLMFNKLDESEEEIDLRKIKGKYFNTRNDVEIPLFLEGKKLNQVIKYLHNKYLELIQFIKESSLQIKEEKILLVSECYAFDCTYFEYEVEYEVIEKCLYQNNLKVVEY